MYYVYASAIAYAFLSFIWTKNGWHNVFIKMMLAGMHFCGIKIFV